MCLVFGLLVLQMMIKRERLHHDDAAYNPTDATDSMVPGTFYLISKDADGRRAYQMVPLP